MNALADFWNWLKSDWGKPNLLTRAGVPRIATNLLTYLLTPYVCYLLVRRYAVSPHDREALRLFVHNRFFLAWYALSYFTLVTDWFLHSRYSWKSSPQESLRFFRNNWKDGFVKAFFLCLAISMLLFLLGALYFIHQLRKEGLAGGPGI
jgi:hypothetical protein